MLTAGYASTLNGSGQGVVHASLEAADRLATRAGLAVSNVVIRGRMHTQEAEIAGALALRGVSLAGFDTDAARAKLERIGWIKTAELQRLWPSTLVVNIVERKPAVLWQDGGVVKAADAGGVVLGEVDAAAYPRLMRVTGEGAPAAARELAAALDFYREVKVMLAAAERISGRRWDLLLSSGTRVKLPETGLGEAVAELGRLLGAQNLPLGDLAVIDLRATGQVALRLKPEAKETRRSLMTSLTARQQGL